MLSTVNVHCHPKHFHYFLGTFSSNIKCLNSLFHSQSTQRSEKKQYVQPVQLCALDYVQEHSLISQTIQA